MLGHFDEEQRSETAESRRKPTGANMFGALVRRARAAQRSLGLDENRHGFWIV